MSDQGSAFPFPEVNGEDFDFAAIFGGGDLADPPPIPELPKVSDLPPEESASGQPGDTAPDPKKVETASKQKTATKAASAESEEVSLFTALTPAEKSSIASVQAETGQDLSPQETPKQVSLFDKLPVFSYGGAEEEIKDPSMTFEELRISKADDFPELEDGKRVSWSVEYGKSSKYISDPKGTTIAKVKEEIEKSKAFLDALKKGKDKDRSPKCLVKPKVTAQNKGIASYKGIFTSEEDAKSSDKVICLFPSQNGQMYELRKTEMGEFIAPKHEIRELSAVRAGFTPALPLIPKELMGQIIQFFRCFMSENHQFEALVHIYWDKEKEEYIVFVPQQSVTKVSIDADLRVSALSSERYLHYADVHSHNSMSAQFSPIDDMDEQATRLYFVVGRLDRFYPSITARFSCGGIHQEIDPSLVLEGIGEDFPLQWMDRVERGTQQEFPSEPFLRSRFFDRGKRTEVDLQ